MRKTVASTTLTVLALVGLLCPPILAEDECGFASIFDGQSLNGWHVSAKTQHSRVSKNKTGGRWVVEDGAIVGSQDIPGNGGLILTDAPYGDFEIALEMNNDFGPDSGLFLRGTEEGKAYQVKIDYHARGNVGGIYGERFPTKLRVFNYEFTDNPETVVPHPSPFPMPVIPAAWPTFWRHGQWNEVRARIVGNPPHITTWVNGVKMYEYTDTEKRHPDKGGIGLQVHSGGDFTKQFVRYRNIRVKSLDIPDNTLSEAEKQQGWLLLFDGKTLNGWMTEKGEPSKAPVVDGCINPHNSGGYLVVHKKQWSDFVLSIDFKISEKCNSGIFFRTFPLEVLPGRRNVAWNGLEMQVFDSQGAGIHDVGAIYDLVAPSHNAMKPVGQWNHAVVTCNDNLITIDLNGQRVNRMDLNQWTEEGKRPDGSKHKFTPVAFKDHPRTGYIGLQEHGHPVWYKNIKILPLNRK